MVTDCNVDTVNFMVYGAAQFISGAMGDEFNPRRVLPISYLCQAVILGLIAMTGFFGGEGTPAMFFAWFILLGLV